MAFGLSSSTYSSTNSLLFNRDVEAFILDTVYLTAGDSKAWGKPMLLFLPLHGGREASRKETALNKHFKHVDTLLNIAAS